MIVYGLSNSQSLARKISRKANASVGRVITKSFPDGELYLRFLEKPIGKVVLVQSMHPNPNSALIELVFAAKEAKELGAGKVVGVVPYLCYMRQDKSFRPWECVSSHHMASLLNNSLDELITIDPHLHRIHDLKEIFTIQAKAITANSLLADYIAKHFKKEIIIGPDIESYQWAERIASRLKLQAIVLRKKRYAARKVRIKIKSSVELKGKNVLIVDDIISSGHTMLETVKEAKRLGAKSITCVAVHGILAEGALSKLEKEGAKVVTTNTIENPTSKIDVSDLIAGSLK